MTLKRGRKPTGATRTGRECARCKRFYRWRELPKRERVRAEPNEAERLAFLDGYVSEARAAEAPLLPPAAESFAAAVAAWELDKALYEVAYELNNRPAWLDLPLDALLGR